MTSVEVKVNILSHIHQIWSMEGTSTLSPSRFVDKEISQAVSQRTGCSTGLGVGVSSWEGPRSAEDGSSMFCSAGGMGLRNWVFSFAFHEQHLLLGSSLLVPGIQPWAARAGWALTQFSACRLHFPSPSSLSRASPVHHSPLTRLAVLLETSSMGGFGVCLEGRASVCVPQKASSSTRDPERPGAWISPCCVLLAC